MSLFVLHLPLDNIPFWAYIKNGLRNSHTGLLIEIIDQNLYPCLKYHTNENNKYLLFGHITFTQTFSYLSSYADTMYKKSTLNKKHLHIILSSFIILKNIIAHIYFVLLNNIVYMSFLCHAKAQLYFSNKMQLFFINHYTMYQ